MKACNKVGKAQDKIVNYKQLQISHCNVRKHGSKDKMTIVVLDIISDENTF